MRLPNRKLGKEEIEPASTSTDGISLDSVAANIIVPNPRSTGSVDRCLGIDYLPVGAPRRNSPKTFPDETGKGTLETGKSYER